MYSFYNVSYFRITFYIKLMLTTFKDINFFHYPCCNVKNIKITQVNKILSQPMTLRKYDLTNNETNQQITELLH